MNAREFFLYIASLPERTVRSLAAGVGGFIFEATEVLFPDWLRRSRLYQATIAGGLRIAVELIGGVPRVLSAEEVDAKELALRKAAGTGIELVGFLTIGWSPLWLLAVAADLTGGTRAYLRALVSELQRYGVVSQDTEITSVEQLLNTLEGTSGLMAETLDKPPLNFATMRSSWQSLRQKVDELPDNIRLANVYAQLQRAAKQEGRSLLTVSSLISTGAVRAGVQLGQTYIFDYYHDALHTITVEGLPAYLRRISKPYLDVAVGHFATQRKTYTERLLQRIQRRRDTSRVQLPKE